MSWNLTEALDYYKGQGAPADQSALIALLTEVQQEQGGSIPRWMLEETAAFFDIKETLLLAIVRRIPRLRLADTHLLEVCTGPNCGKAVSLAAHAEALCAQRPGVTLKFVPCMRQCGKGPNIRFDGRLYHQASNALLDSLILSL